MRVLALETSCDETSAAVLTYRDGRFALESLVILSQDVHRIFGGVVPELASRAHLRVVAPVVDQALREANATMKQVDGVAVTAGPGLIGALLIGLMYGKTLAWRHGLPLIGVHHLEGHLFAPVLEHPGLEPPFVALLVSGGHTMLIDVRAWGDYRLLGQTRDDAAGEAFDKVGSLLGLEYPGGPRVERLAATGTPGRFKLPRPMLGAVGADRYTFSFSGLKTAVLRAVQQSDDLERDRADLARDFQDAAIAVLVEKTARAVGELGYDRVIIGGGVACNRALAGQMRDHLGARAAVHVASPRLNTDNAAMIGAAGAWRLARGERAGWDLEARDNLPRPRARGLYRNGIAMTTAYPFVIKLGTFEVTGFGIMMMVGFLMGGWIIDRDLRRRGLNPDYASDIVFAAVIGGIVGAKLWYVALHGTDALFSRGGLVWYGGFAGGALAVVINGWIKKAPFWWTAQLVAPALPAAYALGRVGCFMVGDDYGFPTSVPWAVAFPQGLPPTTARNLAEFGWAAPAGMDPTTVLAVHPTQLYEVGIMTAAFMLVWKLADRPWGTGWLFGLYLALAGAERFFVELFRAKDDRFLAGFTLAQATSVTLVLIGVAIMALRMGAGRTAPGTYLGGGKK